MCFFCFFFKNCSLLLLGKMAFYSRRLLQCMSISSYQSTPKTTVMEAWELVNLSATYNSASTLLPFNREDFTKNAEVCYKV